MHEIIFYPNDIVLYYLHVRILIGCLQSAKKKKHLNESIHGVIEGNNTYVADVSLHRHIIFLYSLQIEHFVILDMKL